MVKRQRRNVKKRDSVPSDSVASSGTWVERDVIEKFE